MVTYSHSALVHHSVSHLHPSLLGLSPVEGAVCYHGEVGVVSYHGIEVSEAVDLCGVFVEFLTEGVRYIVSWISGDQQYTLSYS